MLSSNGMEKGYRRAALPGLTALRFFAASFVLLFHLFPLTPAAAAHPSVLQRVLNAGFTGVSCFFVLSGFILAYTHPQVRDRAAFFRARFARIYPLYLLAFLLALPVFLKQILLTGPRSQLWAIPADLLLLQNWFPSLALAINTPAWTLSCEAFFYLLFPWLIGQSWLRRTHPLTLVLLLWAVQLLPPVFADFWIIPHHAAWAPFLRDLLFLPLLRLGEFLAGIVLGLAFLRRQTDPACASTASYPWFVWISLALCFGFLSLNLRLPHETVRNGLMLGPYCLLIWALATTPTRLLASAPLQLGGEISYGVYLLQVPASHWLYSLLSRLPLPLPLTRAWYLLLYPIAWVTYVTVEKPCRLLLLGRTRTASPKPIPTPQPELP